MSTIVKAARQIADIAAVGLGLACLAAALAAQGGRFDPRLDVPSHFAPFWLAGALATTLFGASLAPRAWRWPLVGLGLAGCLAAGVLIGPEVSRPIRPAVSADTPGQLTLVQFNTWDSNVDPAGTVAWILAQKPDLVLTEELTPPIRRALIGAGYHYTGGVANTAIFSRAAPIRGAFRLSEADWRSLPGFARATFAGPGGPFSVIAAHLDRPTDADQMILARALAGVAARYPADRLILTGDFNLTPWSFGLAELDRRFHLERRDRALASWPAQHYLAHRLTPFLPFLPIDHVYAGSAWRTVRIARGPRLGSDHYPLVATLALGG